MKRPRTNWPAHTNFPKLIAGRRRAQKLQAAGQARLWRDMDMDAAHDWREIQQTSGIDCRADIVRNVRTARRWNWVAVRARLAANKITETIQ